MPDSILIAELYGPVLQGEGALAGKVSHFVRTAGCGYRCTWCDSMHAVDPEQIAATAQHLTPGEIVAAVRKLPRAPWVTLSGGDPVAWDLEPVMVGLPEYNFAVETQGALWRDWLERCNLITCSPKPPSSGMAARLDMSMLRKYEVRLGSRLVFKIVAFDDADLDFIERVHRAFPRTPLYITSGTPTNGKTRIAVQMAVIDGYREIAEAVLARPKLHDATVLCQQHVLLYGHDKGV